MGEAEGEKKAPARGPPRRIGLFRALQLGDLLCAVPAWRALKAADPAAHLTLIGLPWARDFARRYRHYIDGFIAFPGAPGLPEREADANAYPEFVRRVRALELDLLVQMHGSGELTNPLVAEWGARAVAAFHRGPEARDAAGVRLEWQEHEQEVLRNLRLVAAVNAPACGAHLEFPVDAEEERAADRLMGTLRGEFACIHPGARYPSRRWPAERFAAVGDALAQRGLQVVITGAADESALARSVLLQMRHPAVDCTGRTTLGSFAALVSRARLVVCNDTGMSHVAAAVGVPSIVISSGADAQRWRPLDEARHRMLWHAVHCRPCGHRVCPTAHECALGVGVEAVIAEAQRLLAREAARAA